MPIRDCARSSRPLTRRFRCWWAARRTAAARRRGAPSSGALLGRTSAPTRRPTCRRAPLLSARRARPPRLRRDNGKRPRSSRRPRRRRCCGPCSPTRCPPPSGPSSTRCASSRREMTAYCAMRCSATMATGLLLPRRMTSSTPSSPRLSGSRRAPSRCGRRRRRRASPPQSRPSPSVTATASPSSHRSDTSIRRPSPTPTPSTTAATSHPTTGPPRTSSRSARASRCALGGGSRAARSPSSCAPFWGRLTSTWTRSTTRDSGRAARVSVSTRPPPPSPSASRSVVGETLPFLRRQVLQRSVMGIDLPGQQHKGRVERLLDGMTRAGQQK
mmetsp:Transcript_17875/g.71659  ORF Transcript_17875/g.71659 Transcript_17875/m.71659 type:complete len:329 (+) Transcript_17875:634-1620(+)